ncbi:MAG: VWA domain-containing protein [Verrucomicrobiota bacterium]
MLAHLQSVEYLNWLWLTPVLIGLLVLAGISRKRALQKFIDAGLLDRIKISVSPVARRWKSVLLIGTITLIIVAMSRPAWNPQAEVVERRGRDVVFLLDISRSMLAEDLAPNRLERAKIAIKDAVDRLEGDRVGLVVFAGNAAVKCPLTLDYGFFRMMVDEVSPDSITRGGTMIGDALRKTLYEVFDNQVKQYKDVILITDGEDHESFPVRAAEQAAEQGVRLIAIGLGDENEGRRIPITQDGRQTFLTYNGQEVWTKLDGNMLRQMVASTEGGRYLNVSTGTIDLGEVYQQLILSAERTDLESQTVERYEEKFQIFLAIALIFLCIEWVISDRREEKYAT